MTKKLSLALAILFTIFTLPINGISVEANDKTYDDLADGTYEVKYTVDYEGADFTKHFDQPATLKVKNGKTYLEFKHKDTKLINEITRPDGKVEIVEEDESTRVVGFNIESNLSKPVKIGLKMFYGQTHDVNLRLDLDTLKEVESEVNKPDGTGSDKIESDKEDSNKTESDKSNKEDSNKTEPNKSDKEDSNKTEPNKSDKEDSNKTEPNKSDKEDSNKTEPNKSDKENLNKTEPNKSDKENSNKTEPNKSDKNDSKKDKPLDPKNLPNGVYEVKYSVDYEGDDFTKHFIQPATLKVKNGKTYLEFKHKDIQFINDITRPDGKIEIIKEDESTRVVGFNINPDLSKPVKLGLKMFYGQTHDVNLRLDLETLKEVESEVNKLGGTELDKVESDKEDLNNTESNKSGKEDSNNTESDKSDNNIETESDLKKVSDKAFTINFSIKHANGKETSVADEFFKKPAMLIEKDGNMYAQLTITNGNMVKNLKTEYGEVNVVKVNKDGSIVVQFKVKKDLSNMKLKMLISVPGLYTAEHDAILVFDKNSKKLIKSDKIISPGNGDNFKILSFGEFIKSGKGFNGLNLPENNINHKFGSLSQTNGSHFSGFGSSKTSTPNLNNKLGNTTSSMTGGLDKPEFGSAGSDSQINQVSSNNNPKTGDTSLIWLYGILLVGSLAILVVKLRRRTI